MAKSTKVNKPTKKQAAKERARKAAETRKRNQETTLAEDHTVTGTGKRSNPTDSDASDAAEHPRKKRRSRLAQGNLLSDSEQEKEENETTPRRTLNNPAFQSVPIHETQESQPLPSSQVVTVSLLDEMLIYLLGRFCTAFLAAVIPTSKTRSCLRRWGLRKRT